MVNSRCSTWSAQISTRTSCRGKGRARPEGSSDHPAGGAWTRCLTSAWPHSCEAGEVKPTGQGLPRSQHWRFLPAPGALQASCMTPLPTARTWLQATDQTSPNWIPLLRGLTTSLISAQQTPGLPCCRAHQQPNARHLLPISTAATQAVQTLLQLSPSRLTPTHCTHSLLPRAGSKVQGQTQTPGTGPGRGEGKGDQREVGGHEAMGSTPMGAQGSCGSSHERERSNPRPLLLENNVY